MDDVGFKHNFIKYHDRGVQVYGGQRDHMSRHNHFLLRLYNCVHKK